MARPPELSDQSVTSGPGRLQRPARRPARQGRPDRRVRPRGRPRPRVLLGDHGHRPAPHAGRRRRAGLPGPDRQAGPEHAHAAAVGARRGLLHRRPASRSAPRAPCPPTRAARCGGRSRASRSSATPDRRPRARVLPLRADDETGGLRRYVDNLSMVYTVGPQADPKGVVRQITEALSRLGMGTFAANHEFMNSQYEINLRHAPALTAADRAFRLKCAVKDVAAIHGLLATFMGKPFNDQGGSGFHFHFSLDREDDNAFADHRRPDGVSAELRHFTAGILAHAHALTAFLNPTINAYRRLVPGQPRADARQLGLGQPHELHPHPGRARARLAGRGARRRRQREPVPGDRRAPVRRPARRARQARRSARPSAATRTRSTTPASRCPPASRTRSTRSRPTRCCATRWARRSSTLPGHQALRARAAPPVGVGLGARRVPPSPLGRHDDAAADRPLRSRRVPGARPLRVVQDPPRGGPGPLERGARRHRLLRRHPLPRHPPGPPPHRALLAPSSAARRWRTSSPTRSRRASR